MLYSQKLEVCRQQETVLRNIIQEREKTIDETQTRLHEIELAKESSKDSNKSNVEKSTQVTRDENYLNYSSKSTCFENQLKQFFNDILATMTKMVDEKLNTLENRFKYLVSIPKKIIE